MPTKGQGAPIGLRAEAGTRSIPETHAQAHAPPTTRQALGIKVLGSCVMHSDENPRDQIKFLFNLFKQLNENSQCVPTRLPLWL